MSRILPSLADLKSLSIRAVRVMLLGLAFTATAAETKKKAAPPPESTESAFLRVWKSDFASKRSIRITRRATGRKGAATDLVEMADGYRFGDYIAVAAGAATFEVVEAKAPGARLASIAAPLAPGSFTTLLVQENDGAITAELLDDTIKNGDVTELVVRNFAPTLKFVQIDAGPDLHARLVSANSFLDIRGLPRARLQIETSGEQSAGEALKWSNEVDFTKFPRATVLIYPDAYGRIRPRVVIDGQNLAGTTEGAPLATPTGN